jgi:hypothetical protein
MTTTDNSYSQMSNEQLLSPHDQSTQDATAIVDPPAVTAMTREVNVVCETINSPFETHRLHPSIDPTVLQFSVYPHVGRQCFIGVMSVGFCLPCMCDECKVDIFELRTDKELWRRRVALVPGCSEEPRRVATGVSRAFLGITATHIDGQDASFMHMGALKVQLASGRSYAISRGGQNSTNMAGKKKLYRAINQFLATEGEMHVSTMNVSGAVMQTEQTWTGVRYARITANTSTGDVRSAIVSHNNY